MLRALVVGMLALVVTSLLSAQTPSILHIKIVLVDADGKPSPVPRHELLISDNPSSAPPRLIVTTLDGTADVRLRPGNYTVESDRPVTFHGKAYHWRQTVDIAAGRDAVMELKVENAEVEAVTPSPATESAAPADVDPSLLLPQWQDSVVALWTPVAHASGFVVDTKGLIATNQRVIGNATSIEVQLTPTLKLAATVLASDPLRDAAVLWIDPAVIASVRPIPLACGQAAPPLKTGEEILTIGAPLRQRKGIASGTVNRIDAESMTADLMLSLGSTGGPVFSARGDVIGLTSFIDENNEQSRRDGVRIVRNEDACAVIAVAQQKMTAAAAPSVVHLPVEPAQPFPLDALKDAAQRRGGALNPYQVSSSTFDVAFITPVLTYGAQYQAQQPRPRTTSKDTRKPDPEPPRVRPLMDFSNWSEYVSDFPPVLLVRVTPKMVEGFWTTVARGAARTQGVSIPPIKRIKSGFGRLRTFCGDREVTPIHPFKLEQRSANGDDAVYEGLYVFDPAALAPECGSLKLMLYSEKEPDKAETKVVDQAVLQQIWQDFEPYRKF